VSPIWLPREPKKPTLIETMEAALETPLRSGGFYASGKTVRKLGGTHDFEDDALLFVPADSREPIRYANNELNATMRGHD
jgi:hypothetical protein